MCQKQNCAYSRRLSPTFIHVYAYLSRLHYKTFHMLKYYFHEFTQYYNRNVRKSSHQSSNVGIVDGSFFPP